MKHSVLSPGSLIADLLEASPPVASLLLELRLDCLGCSMNKFCTLEELCSQYDLDVGTFLCKVQEKISSSKD